MNKTSVEILPGFFLFSAAAVLLIPLPWLVAWTVAALVHEFFHLMAVFLYKYRVLSVRIGPGGARIQTDIPYGFSMTVCALAGPIGGLLPLLFLHSVPRLALCGLIQSLYNLLPMRHLDGGQALYGIMASFLLPETAIMISVLLERVLLFFLVLAAVYGYVVLKIGIIPLLFVCILLFKNKKSLANKAS